MAAGSLEVCLTNRLTLSWDTMSSEHAPHVMQWIFFEIAGGEKEKVPFLGNWLL